METVNNPITLGWHPLIDRKNSPHYDANEGKTAIQKLEDDMTICEMRGFCYGNIQKYKYRLVHKGQAESDLEKIGHFRAYLEALNDLKTMTGIAPHMGVTRAWKLAGIVWRYR